MCVCVCLRVPSLLWLTCMACSRVVAALRLVALCGSPVATTITASIALAMYALTPEFFIKPSIMRWRIVQSDGNLK